MTEVVCKKTEQAFQPADLTPESAGLLNAEPHSLSEPQNMHRENARSVRREELYPVNRQYLNVLEGVTIYNTGTWWQAVLLTQNTTRQNANKEVNIYLWQNRGGAWKRVSKTKINPKYWRAIKEAVETLLVR